MGGPFTDKLRALATGLTESNGVLSDDEIDNMSATLTQAACAIELLESELEEAKR